MKPIIFCGKLCSGKTTAANYIVRRHNYIRKYAFADWMRKTLRSHYNSPIVKGSKINGKDVRSMMCEFGNMLRNFDEDWHIDELCNTLFEHNNLTSFVVDDCRFPNEAIEMKDRFKGVVVKISCTLDNRLLRSYRRDNYVPSKEQVLSDSENSVDDIKFDYEIINEGTEEEFQARLDHLIWRIHGKTV